MISRPRVAVLHGANLDQLGRRDPEVYGTLTLRELETRIERDADELGILTQFLQTNHEGELVEHLHRLESRADGVILNAGAWTHYSWALRDALEICGLPTVEVHLSDVQNREPWRRLSVFDGLCLETFAGQGPAGYRQALELLRRHFEERGAAVDLAKERARQIPPPSGPPPVDGPAPRPGVGVPTGGPEPATDPTPPAPDGGVGGVGGVGGTGVPMTAATSSLRHARVAHAHPGASHGRGGR